ncbi:DNA (cytosine-5-)-methyltransferase [Luteibacter sp. 3190]|uniref:DNA cytosine methyltransferase n=1 Tax=Luteibacter sp. 3190 TaxID=2817736 RepID=UPI0028543F52|nr:DNA (cytosine-5-)-methyltransferase [Luteibacter sp. 3190]MDR6938196.1 DNA (cytosine-5)-methyltransferase 1 [Luteibacter sp. 3190]
MTGAEKVAGRLKCISLFSGCGGLDIGAHAAGFDVIVATDIESTCAETYAQNFPSVPFITRRIGDVESQDLLHAAGVDASQVDLLIGGPPCPAFSKSRFYRTEKPRALDDPVAAETVGGYLRMLREIRPKAFLLENVKGLSYGVHRQALDHILQTAADLGYATEVHIVNAADYGVPQIRERCLVVGSLNGPVQVASKKFAKMGTDENLPPWRTAGEALSDLDTDELARDDDGHFAGGQFNDLLRLIPPGENYLHFTAERGHPEPRFKWRSRYWSFLLKLSPSLPSWTIQARRSNNMGPFHWRSRILRITEIKRLQTFPDNFVLAGNVEQQWRQVGNAVPPLLAEHFCRSIYEKLMGVSQFLPRGAEAVAATRKKVREAR